MRAVWYAISVGGIVLAWRAGLGSGYMLLTDSAIAPVIALALGGAVARLAAGTSVKPGWLGLGAVWILAISFGVFAPTPIALPPTTREPPPALPPSGDGYGSIHIPDWLLVATVYAAFAYLGDRLACRFMLRKARP